MVSRFLSNPLVGWDLVGISDTEEGIQAQITHISGCLHPSSTPLPPPRQPQWICVAGKEGSWLDSWWAGGGNPPGFSRDRKKKEGCRGTRQSTPPPSGGTLVRYIRQEGSIECRGGGRHRLRPRPRRRPTAAAIRGPTPPAAAGHRGHGVLGGGEGRGNGMGWVRVNGGVRVENGVVLGVGWGLGLGLG